VIILKTGNFDVVSNCQVVHQNPFNYCTFVHAKCLYIVYSIYTVSQKNPTTKLWQSAIYNSFSVSAFVWTSWSFHTYTYRHAILSRDWRLC